VPVPLVISQTHMAVPHVKYAGFAWIDTIEKEIWYHPNLSEGTNEVISSTTQQQK
tara:strand:- start:801 stop:965 length:165 start_codon:yes stop_codon:yes gene_type:complete